MQNGDNQDKQTPRHRIIQSCSTNRHHPNFCLHQIEVSENPRQDWKGSDGHAQAGKQEERWERHLVTTASVLVKDDAAAGPEEEGEDDAHHADDDRLPRCGADEGE